VSFEDSDLHIEVEDNSPPRWGETATKLTCLENTENRERKTEREKKIKSQHVNILLRRAGVNAIKIWKETLIICCCCEYEGKNS
jgi:hypothetical protein